MADYVLDTHACVFALSAPRRLGRRARRVLTGPGDHRFWLPAAAAAEIALLRELGRIELGLPELRTAMDTSSLLFLDLTWQQLNEFSSLTSIRDPFDRLIVSAARSLGARLISKDETLADSGLVDVVWS
jgi:PIN domain nuclease of toxin-antitoxin system